MSMNPLNDISAVYMREVFKPQLGKGGEKPAAGGKKVEKGKDDAESSAKRVRQAVYDIRYRARREEVKLDQAYNQYMGHTTMTGPEKAAVKEKLGLGPGAASVSEETEVKKYQVRVKDKATGKSYVRMATREKINQLRANPNISSVEMTQYGTPYEGERKKGKQTASVTSGKGLDPVGREDKDIDNDGDHDKTDKYLLNRRKVRGTAIAQRKVKEEFSDWRSDLREVINEVQKEGGEGKIKEKSVKNKIVINPEVKIEMNQIADKLGGQLIEMVEIEEGYKEIDREKHGRMYDRYKKLRTAAMNDARETGEASGLNRYKMGKMSKVLDKSAENLRNKAKNEEFELDEKTLTSAETKKKEEIVKSMKKNLAGFKQRYGERAKEVMYATATARAKEVAEEAPQMTGSAATANKIKQLKAQQSLLQKQQQLEKQKEALAKSTKTVGEEVEQLDEISQKTATRAYATSYTGEFEGQDSDRDVKRTDNLRKHIKRKFGDKAAQHADRAGHSMTFGRKGAGGMPPVKEEVEQIDEVSYSAKAARAGKDIGKPGKAFAKIAASAGKRYGSKERGEKVAGAVLAKLRKEETEQLDERTKQEKVAGTPRPSRDKALEIVKGSMRKMTGTPAGQQKKVPGKKPPAAGEYGGPQSPAQKVAARRAAAQRAQDAMHSPRD